MKPTPQKKKKNPAAVALGRLGGLATKGIKKRGGVAQARRAARARWARVRAAQKQHTQSNP